MTTASRIAFASLLALACGASACSSTETSQGGDPGAAGAVPGLGGPGAPAPLAAPTKLTITEVAVFQGVKVSVFADGARVVERNAPLVAGRTALVRVYVTPGEGFEASKIAGVLTLKSADGKTTTYRDSRLINGKSSDAILASTLGFEIPGEALGLGSSFSVALTDDIANGPAQQPVRYPAEAEDDLELKPTSTLKVVVVPVRFDADSSQRLPDITEAQLGLYKKTMMALYPASDVVVTAREPFAWSTSIAPNGQGWDDVLNAMVGLRRRDRADDETYYYGVFKPAASFGEFCRKGCVLGLSGLVSRASDSFLRASVGLGYTGIEAANTMAHELGHAHGREHAPCGGAAGADRSFPYRGGTIGSWGYDLFAKKLISPAVGKDMMGYCDPSWVSDYTYSALHERIVAVGGGTTSANGAKVESNGGSFRIISFDADGLAKTSETIELATAPQGTVSDVDYLGDHGDVLAKAKAHVYRYDHLPGGIVVVPEQAPGFRALRVADMARIVDLRSVRAR